VAAYIPSSAIGDFTHALQEVDKNK